LLEFQRKHEEFISALAAIFLSWNSVLMVFSKLFTSLPLCTLDLRLQLGLIFKRTPGQAFLHTFEGHIMIV